MEGTSPFQTNSSLSRVWCVVCVVCVVCVWCVVWCCWV
jgi:hypothetical protein